ncbi:MAG: alpha/beta hydrolase family esterase [Planctomycetota bacterium]
MSQLKCNYAAAALAAVLLQLTESKMQDSRTSRPATDSRAIGAGDHEMSFVYSDSSSPGGRRRSWILHIPKSYDASAALPLVLVFHGGMGTARQAANQYHWPAKADAENFIVVFPDGVGLFQTWNAGHCCGAALRENADDVGFIRALIEEISKTVNINNQKIYATGMSNGGMFAHRLAAECSDQIAAAAAVAGTIGGKANSRAKEYKVPNPKNPVPMMIIHGMLDKNVLYHGGETQLGAAAGRIDLSVAESVAFWAAANRCETQPASMPSPSPHITIEKYSNSRINADVVLVTLKNQGHAWPGGKRGSRALDAPSTEISATDMIWEFFRSHSRSERAPAESQAASQPLLHKRDR